LGPEGGGKGGGVFEERTAEGCGEGAAGFTGALLKPNVGEG